MHCIYQAYAQHIPGIYRYNLFNTLNFILKVSTYARHMLGMYRAYTLGYLQFKINNYAFSILFELHMHCICVGWAWSKAERGPGLNLKFGPRWTFGPRRVFFGPRRAVTPTISTVRIIRIILKLKIKNNAY